MDGNTTISIALAISVGGFIFTWLNYIKTSKRDNKNDSQAREKEIEEKIKMNMKLDQLCNTTNDIRTSQKAQEMKLEAIDKRLITVEQSEKSLHKRVDRIDKLFDLEKEVKP